jgi:hypothetical protein
MKTVAYYTVRVEITHDDSLSSNEAADVVGSNNIFDLDNDASVSVANVQTYKLNRVSGDNGVTFGGGDFDLICWDEDEDGRSE